MPSLILVRMASSWLVASVASTWSTSVSQTQVTKLHRAQKLSYKSENTVSPRPLIKSYQRSEKEKWRATVEWTKRVMNHGELVEYRRSINNQIPTLLQC
jgi:hypothetical protein